MEVKYIIFTKIGDIVVNKRLFCHFFALMCCVFSSIALAQGQLRSRNSLSLQAMLGDTARTLRVTRGVLFQSLAGFSTPTGEGVSPEDVILVREGNDVCIRIEGSPCAPLDFSFAELSGIFEFVSSGRHVAFTAPTSFNNPGEIESIASGMGLGKSRFGEQWIAGELDMERLYNILEYVDFSEGFADSTSSLFDDRRRMENSLSGLNYTEDEILSAIMTNNIVDGTYFNADFYADYVVSVEKSGDLLCEGLPARYHWFLLRGDEKAFLYDVEPANAGISVINREALSMFCTTAIIRRLNEDAPDSLQIFR